MGPAPGIFLPLGESGSGGIDYTNFSPYLQSRQGLRSGGLESALWVDAQICLCLERKSKVT